MTVIILGQFKDFFFTVWCRIIAFKYWKRRLPAVRSVSYPGNFMGSFSTEVWTISFFSSPISDANESISLNKKTEALTSARRRTKSRKQNHEHCFNRNGKTRRQAWSWGLQKTNPEQKLRKQLVIFSCLELISFRQETWRASSVDEMTRGQIQTQWGRQHKHRGQMRTGSSDDLSPVTLHYFHTDSDRTYLLCHWNMGLLFLSQGFMCLSLKNTSEWDVTEMIYSDKNTKHFDPNLEEQKLMIPGLTNQNGFERTTHPKHPPFWTKMNSVSKRKTSRSSHKL